ncbi:MAG: pilus assembly protein N-terminal domain-containing protein [Pirellulales bacterium]
MNLLAGVLSVFSGWAGLSNECHAQQQQFTSQWALTNTPLNVDLQSGRQKLDMVVNTSRELVADQPFRSLRIHNQEMLTAIPLAGNKLQISAKKTGVTQVDLVSANEAVSTLEVMVLGDVRELEAILRKTLPDATFELTPLSQGIIVTGHVSNGEDVSTISQIAQQYFPTVINRVTVMGVHTKQLQTQIMEVSRTKLRSLGIDWALTTGSDSVISNVAGSLAGSGTAIATQGTTPFTFSVVDNGTNFKSAIDALRRNNLVKVLATPTLTAVDGRPASFNSGGEIPIVVPAGLGQVGIQFREFGTRLDYVAKVLGNGKIYLEVRPYVSEIDPSRSVTIQNVSVPGIRSRFLETGVELQAGQTLALAGLLQVRTEAINQGIPGLSDVPFFGAFFRRTREEQNEVELLITVTPDFAGPMEPQQVPHSVPGVHSMSPTDRELYFKGYMEVPATSGGNCPPPMGMMESAVPGAQMGMVQQPPVPRPSAMSIGPNAPTLAETNYRLLPQPNPQTAVTPTQGTYR